MLWMQRFVTKKPLKGFNTMRLGLVQGRDISSFSSGELSSSIWSCSYKPGQGSCNFCCFTITTSSGWCHSASRQHPMAVLSLVILVQKQGNESMRNSLSPPAGIPVSPRSMGKRRMSWRHLGHLFPRQFAHPKYLGWHLPCKGLSSVSKQEQNKKWHFDTNRNQ